MDNKIEIKQARVKELIARIEESYRVADECAEELNGGILLEAVKEMYEGHVIHKVTSHGTDDICRISKVLSVTYYAKGTWADAHVDMKYLGTVLSKDRLNYGFDFKELKRKASPPHGWSNGREHTLTLNGMLKPRCESCSTMDPKDFARLVRRVNAIDRALVDSRDRYICYGDCVSYVRDGRIESGYVAGFNEETGLITVTVGYDHEEYQTITEDMPGANLVVFKDVEEKERDFNYK